MKLIKPSFEILEQGPELIDIYLQIEKCARIAYKSEDKITEKSYEKFFDMLYNRGHWACFEQGTVYMIIPDNKAIIIDFYMNNPYSRVYHVGEAYYVTTNLRVILENKRDQDLYDFRTEPGDFHARRVCVKCVVDRGVSHEAVRHRTMSFIQESTRYCNYSKDKFNGEVTFIQPCWLPDGDNSAPAEEMFLESLYTAEKNYLLLLKEGWTPQQARSVLPNALKTEICITGFIDDWEHFFELRCAKDAHPQMREIAIPIRDEFIKRNYINGD